MAKHCLIVFSDPEPGKEDEYNTWYTQRHLPDVLKVPGFSAAQRFKIVGDSTLPGRYMAIYEMDADDPDAVMAEIFKRVGTPAMVLTDAMDVNKTTMAVCTAISERVLPQ